MLLCYLKALKWRHASPHILHVNLSYDSSTCTRKWKHLFTCNPFDILGESSSFLQKCIRSYNGCICKNAFVIPQPSHKNAFVVTLDAFVRKHFCESSSCPQKCIRKYIGCICKKTTSQCQWSLASHKIRIGFISLVVCFDLLGPKFLMSARQLKKEGWWRLTKCDSNGGHLHARKGEDQVQLPPDLPDSSRRMLASISMLSILGVATAHIFIADFWTFHLNSNRYFLSLSLPAANWGVWRFPKFHFHFSETIQMFSVARRPPHQ